MTHDPFDQTVGLTRQRLERLSRRAEDLPAEARDLVAEILEAFAISVEELQVSAEELHQQNQELQATRQEVEVQRRSYRDLFEFAPDGYLVTDPLGLIQDANQAAVDLLSVPRAALVGKPLVLYVASGERARFHSYLDRLVEEDRVPTGQVEWEMQLQPRRGPAFPAALTVAPAVGTEGELTGLRWLLRDIRASKRAEERERLLAEARAQRRAAQEANQLLQALIETMPVGAMIADSEGNLVKINAAAIDILGSTVSGTIKAPKRAYTSHHPDGTPFPPGEMPLIHALHEGRTTHDLEVLIRRADGQERTILAAAAPVRDEAGQIISGIAVFQDITDRKQADAERERLLAILEATPDLIAMATAGGELVYLNRAARRTLGIAEDDDLAGRTIPLGQPPWAVRLARKEALPTALRQGVWRGRTAVLDAQGREIPVSQIVLAHPGPNGEVAYLSSIARDVSQRERILAELQEERARFRAIFENAPEAILVADARGRILLANEAAHHLYRRPVPLDQPFEPADSVQALHPDGHPFSPDEYPILRSALHSEHVPQTEMTLLWDDGLRRDLLISSAPLQDVDGRSLGAVSLIQDITELKEAQRALERYADRLRVLHAADRVILSAGSADEIVEAVLPLTRKLVHCRRASVLTFDREAGEAILLGVHTDAGTRLGKGTRLPLDEAWPLQALAEGEMSLVEDASTLAVPPSVARDLQNEELLSFINVPLVAQGELLGTLNLALADPEELRAEHRQILRQMADELAIGLRQARLHREVHDYANRLEEMVASRTAALQASEARFRTIFEGAAVGMALLDGMGHILAGNPALHELLGYTEQELAGTNFTDHLHPGDVQANQGLYETMASAEMGYYQAERQYTRRDGEVRWAEMTISRIANAKGDETELFIIMVDDVTEKKRTQQALIQAERLAVAGRVGASLAHEINNPLQSVIGCLGLAEETLEDGPDVHRYLQVALEELERAADIVHRLRDLNREARTTESRPTDLNAVLEKVLILVRKQCRDHQITVEWTASDNLPLVRLPPDNIQQVFLNLALNAIEAMPHGGQLSVGTAPTARPDGIEIAFADTGVGIEPQVLAQIFEPFHSTRPDGMGLGLYISHSIVERFGGHIGVDSTPGEGTTFTIWLPIPIEQPLTDS
ncbi:MAG: PAS domain S-box protein [Anaerolineae bacterium]